MVLMILGALFLAMPIAIIGSEFDRAWASHTETDQKNQNIEAQSNLRRTLLSQSNDSRIQSLYQHHGGNHFTI